MLPISDDAELTEMAMKHNAELEESMGDEIEPVESVDDLIKASRSTGKKSASQGDERLDLYDELERIDQQTEMTDPEEFEIDELEIKVSENLADFRDAVALAEINGLESIQASKKVIFHFTKPTYPKNGYFFYHGIRIDEAGKTEAIERHLAMTTEEVNFGKGR